MAELEKLIFFFCVLLLAFPLLLDQQAPGGSNGKESTCNAGDPGSIPGSGRSPGEGNGLPIPVFLAWRITWTEKPGYTKTIAHVFF